MEWINVKDKEAPRDGKMFRSYSKKWGVQQVRWSKLYDVPKDCYWDSVPKDRRGNFTDLTGCAGRIGSFDLPLQMVTHWKPLDEPPKEEGE